MVVMLHPISLFFAEHIHKGFSVLILAGRSSKI